MVLPTHRKIESTVKFSEGQDESLRLRTASGCYHVNWDNEAPVTPHGQLAFFAQYLHSADLFKRWVSDCPLEYKSNNAPKRQDVLGTFLLSILSGHSRYAHVDSIYGDVVNSELLNLKQTVSSDSARRAFARIDEEKCESWQHHHLMNTYESLLNHPYVLDIDTTVKVLYGNQEGAVVGYNPKKPGRPSHCYHTYFIGKIRIVLDVEVRPGNESSSLHSQPKLWKFIDKLQERQKPRLIRGDVAYGVESMLNECEKRNLSYLSKVRMTGNVKKLVKQLEGLDTTWEDAGKGWQGCKSKLKLSGWSRTRQVVVLRRPVTKQKKDAPALLPENHQTQKEFSFVEVLDKGSIYEYTVLVTNLEDSILSIAQLYRDRGDCENVIDELKNHWGWSGFTTTDLKRSQIMARMIAQVYNWWTVFCRLAIPQKHTEAITSRPLFFRSIGRLVLRNGQRMIRLSSINSQASQIQKIMGKISRFLEAVRSNAAQLTAEQRWTSILNRAFEKFLGNKKLPALSDGPQMLLGI